MGKQKASASPGLFTAADHRALRIARTDLADLLGRFDKAKACGADCSMFEQMRTDIDNQLAAIELHFMTPAPTN